MEIAKANTLAQVKQAQENVQEEQKKLEEIYGSVTIDLNTGEITEQEEATE
jgi:3-isopropylmalate dehydratase small subunit